MATAASPRPSRAASPSPGQAAVPKRASQGQAYPRRVGVIFVHGIGTQAACETFLDWSAPIVKLLSDWRLDHKYSPDPVKTCRYDLTGAHLPILELDVPEHQEDGLTWPGQTWVLTEAWWAATTRPPSLGFMLTYTRRALPRIVRGIKTGYLHQMATASWQSVRVRARSAVSQPTYAGPAEARQLVLGNVPARRDWVDWLDRAQMGLSILVLPIYPVIVVGGFLSSVYGAFRSIPIRKLKELGPLQKLDTFLTKWFGGLPDISEDALQAANARARLAAAIRGLRLRDCDRIIVVAHSGGAVVSFTTLCDPAYMAEKVDMLVTLGEGLALAWRIEDTGYSSQPPSRLQGDLVALRRDLKWVDFWSSYDPAPAGPLNPPPGVSIADTPHMTVNRMSILEDHGAYWDNDEQFVIPLIRHLDSPDGLPDNSRFFRDEPLHAVRLAWRRKRVAALALWRWIATLGGATTIGAATLYGGRATRLGGAVIAPLAPILQNDFVAWLLGLPSGAIPAIGQVVQSLQSAMPEPVNDYAPGIISWLVGAAVIALPFLLLLQLGVGYWRHWDERARADSHHEVPGRPRGMRLEGGLWLGGFSVAAAVLFASILYALTRAWP
jgi:hypothetical protein